ADCHTWQNHDILADVAAASNPGTSHYVREVPYLCSLTDLARLVDVARFVHDVVFFRHISLNYLSTLVRSYCPGAAVPQRKQNFAVAGNDAWHFGHTVAPGCAGRVENGLVSASTGGE